VKLARTINDRRLAIRRIRADTRIASAWGQYSVFEDVVGNIDAHEQPCVKHYRGRREPGTRNPCGRKGQERHHEEMDEVDPYQSQRRRTYEPPKVVVVYPNNGDEQIAHHIADDRRPQRSESREHRLIRRPEVQYHDGHDHREDPV